MKKSEADRKAAYENLFKNAPEMPEIKSGSLQSSFFKINLLDFVKGLILAVLTSVVTIIQTTLENSSLTFAWKLIGITAISSAIGYLIKNLLTNSEGQFLKKEVK